MAVAINIMDGSDLNNKVHYTKGVTVLAAHFIRVGIPRFLHHQQGESTSVIQMSGRMHNEGLKKTRLLTSQ